MIQPEFFNFVVFSIFRALGEKLGEGAWEVVWRTGEILLSEIARIRNVRGETPLTTLRNLADYLVEVGYVSSLEITPLGPDRLRYVMGKPAILDGARKLIEAQLPPPHLSTALMFAALKTYHGLRAEMVGEPELLPDGTAVETWVLKPMDS